MIGSLLRAYHDMVDKDRRQDLYAYAAKVVGIGIDRQPPIDLLGTGAVRSVSKLTDETHAAVLALIDELLAIGTTKDAGLPREASVHPCPA